MTTPKTLFLLSLAAVAAALACFTPASAAVKLPAIVGDNMVVQQKTKVRVWGWADPNERVTVTMHGSSASATAGADGRWEVKVGPYDAGGPYEMTVAGSNTITIKNVLVGEVWVGSGQSNMEFQLQNSVNGAADVAAANDAQIRLFTVTRATSVDPRADVEGHWDVCSPETVGSFSAVAYYFGRDLRRDLKVPVGLIHTSWGGTPAEAWTSREGLAAEPSLAPMLSVLDQAKGDPGEAQKAYTAALAKWESENMLQDPGNAGVGMGYAKPDFDDADWKPLALPRTWETVGMQVDGSVWFRRAVDVPADWAGKDLALDLGAIDDFDTTYVNGEKVGAIGAETPQYYQAQRKYVVPGSLVRAGKNVIAVRVFDHVGDGGFTGPATAMSIAPASGGTPISLAGEWRMKPETVVPQRSIDYSTQPIPPPGAGNPNTPTVLYNAMLGPITPYTIRGAIWYQGEANADRAAQYRTLFPAMIRDWRRAWGEGDFPFYFVQLANFMARHDEPSESHWAELREAQTSTLSLPKTGMAVIIDVGEANDIHPKNKHDVGHRLALWALAETYGEKVEYSGPLYASMKVDGGAARVRFDHAKGLKTSDGGQVKGFAVAGADGRFVWADAKIDGESVVVSSASVPAPVAVRYAWADNPAANLTNGDGLPASPFRTDGPRK